MEAFNKETNFIIPIVNKLNIPEVLLLKYLLKVVLHLQCCSSRMIPVVEAEDICLEVLIKAVKEEATPAEDLA